MLDIVDAIHYLIGLLFLAVFLWVIIQTHKYFSKNNKKIEEIQSMYTQ
jgi:hypothetical protein